MAEIRVLEKQVSELIAAGEVIDRPASVVKELVENAVDAGASAVTVEIKNGGVTFIRVTDDGCGIPRDQVATAFLRHATSKVHTESDLEHIGTLGFRGEALASVCAVSEVEIFTRTAEELAGTHLQNSGGELLCNEEAGCAKGTTIVVRNLFFNTPARLKFLKTDAVEGGAVGTVMDNLALSHPELSVRFIRDGKDILHTPGDGKLKSAVYAVFGREFSAGLLPVEYTLNGVRVWGFVTKPTAARPNRRMQQFFINGRYVKSQTARVALEQAFKNSIMVGKFPGCVLHIELNCAAVDVNVHPTKLEVRFVNERPVFDAVYHGVKTALSGGDTPPVVTFPEKKSLTLQEEEPPSQMELVPKKTVSVAMPEKKSEPISKVPTVSQEERHSWRVWEQQPAITEKPVLREGSSPFVPRYPVASSEAEAPPKIEQPASQATPEPRFTEPEEPVIMPHEDVPLKTRVVGELFHTYIVVEREDDTVLLIDKHAAHERLLFEKLKSESGIGDAQLLLTPITVTLQKEEYRVVLEAQELFAQAGFELEDFGEGTLLIRTAPLYLEGSDIGSTVLEMAGHLCSHRTDLSTEHLDWLYHNIACRAAIKAGNHSQTEELIALASRLEQHPEVRYCPHGRPISIVLRRRDLEKQFGRIQ